MVSVGEEQQRAKALEKDLQKKEKALAEAAVNEKIQGAPLVLHSDNESPMKSSTFQCFLEKMGFQSSYSRPRVSIDTPFSEAMFRTLKYRPDFPSEGFEMVEEARVWAAKFIRWYNEIHLHSALRFVTPVRCHTGEHLEILKKRKEVYEDAKQRYPERWTRGIRNWSAQEQVALNPMKEIVQKSPPLPNDLQWKKLLLPL